MSEINPVSRYDELKHEYYHALGDSQQLWKDYQEKIDGWIADGNRHAIEDGYRICKDAEEYAQELFKRWNSVSLAYEDRRMDQIEHDWEMLREARKEIDLADEGYESPMEIRASLGL